MTSELIVCTSPPLVALLAKAVCNDGTPAGYFFQKGWGTGSNVWILYLEGGYWCVTFFRISFPVAFLALPRSSTRRPRLRCWDAESCALRYNTSHFQMSSSDCAWS